MGNPVKNVLIVCQRRIGGIRRNPAGPDINDVEDVKIVNSKLESEIKKVLDAGELNIEYLSSMGGFLGEVDHQINLVKHDEEAWKFIREKTGKYDLIVLQTCPILYMCLEMIHQMLKDDGNLLIIAISPGKVANLNNENPAGPKKIIEKSGLFNLLSMPDNGSLFYSKKF